MQVLIEKYKTYRKKKQLEKVYTSKYAFIGIGNHSINNLYPVINFLNASLKYIVTKNKDTASFVNDAYDNIEGTNDLDKVLNDSDIKGVFISANPKSHFSLIKKVLAKDKNVYVEKPPCSTLDELNELIELEKKSKGFVLVGFQKRYAPLFNILKPNLKDAKYYNLRFFTGNYPEGDEILDLFIHPLDIVSYLFGESKILSSKKINTQKGATTYLLHIEHNNGIIGNIELSTDFWWAKAKESFYINTEKYIYESENTSKLIRYKKPTTILNIPLEKIKPPVITTELLYEKNEFLPVKEHNQLYSSGYFNEIKTFLDLSEGLKTENLSSLKSLISTYNLIENL